MTEQWQELKETIKELRYSNGDLTQQEVCSFLGVYMETLEKQMQQPSDDCISRQAVLNIFDEWFATCNIADKRESPKAKINALPSVKPKYTDEEIDKAQAVEQAYVDKMVELAVAETKRPKGKWIWDLRMGLHKCSVCSKFCDFDYLYCPNCGAYMRGEE